MRPLVTRLSYSSFLRPLQEFFTKPLMAIVSFRNETTILAHSNEKVTNTFAQFPWDRFRHGTGDTA